MIRITVVSCGGTPPAAPLAARFTRAGGSIGRGEGSTLVLDDPGRRISRTHAEVFERGSRFHIRDQGAAFPVLVNGRPLGRGNEAPIVDGDELVIGEYRLLVSLDGAPPVRAPTAPPAPTPGRADFLGAFGGGGAASGSGNPFADLLSPLSSGQDAPPDQSADPFAGLPGMAPPAPVAAAPRAVASPTPIPARGPEPNPLMDLAPADDDPFGNPVAKASAVPPSLPDADEFAGQGIDDLIGAGATGPMPDPFPTGHPLGASPDAPATPSGTTDDPFADLFGEAPKAPPGLPQRDDASELHAPFDLPPVIPAAVTRVVDTAAPAAPKDPPTPRPAVADRSGMLSWAPDAGDGGGIQTLILPANGGAGARGPTPASPASMPRPATPMPPSAVMRPVVASQSDSGSTPASGELLAAFLEGAGVPDLDMAPLTPALARQLGEQYREALQGVLDLLAARQITKREIRSDVTVIRATENNPLKFSPNVDWALAQMLAPKNAGYLMPTPALREAFQDLRAHQIASMAGMKAALASLIARFDPTAIERQLSKQGLLDNIIPGLRRARYWELFEQRFGEIAAEAENDFHRLLGEAFNRAYEAELDALGRRSRGSTDARRRPDPESR